MEKRIIDLLTTRLLTVEEAATYTGLNIPAIQQRIWRGKLEAIKKGHIHLVDKLDLTPKKENK